MPKLTVELATKFVPVNVRVNAAPPTVALVGLIMLSVGAGLGVLEMLKTIAGVEVPPPGAGLVTVTLALPTVAMSAAGTVS